MPPPRCAAPLPAGKAGGSGLSMPVQAPLAIGWDGATNLFMGVHFVRLGGGQHGRSGSRSSISSRSGTRAAGPAAAAPPGPGSSPLPGPSPAAPAIAPLPTKMASISAFPLFPDFTIVLPHVTGCLSPAYNQGLDLGVGQRRRRQCRARQNSARPLSRDGTIVAQNLAPDQNAGRSVTTTGISAPWGRIAAGIAVLACIVMVPVSGRGAGPEAGLLPWWPGRGGRRRPGSARVCRRI
jgi:hypothetical protein